MYPSGYPGLLPLGPTGSIILAPVILSGSPGPPPLPLTNCTPWPLRTGLGPWASYGSGATTPLGVTTNVPSRSPTPDPPAIGNGAPRPTPLLIPAGGMPSNASSKGVSDATKASPDATEKPPASSRAFV